MTTLIMRPLALVLLLGASCLGSAAYADEVFDHPTIAAHDAQQRSTLQYNATTGTYRVVSQKPMVSAPIAAPIPAVRMQPNSIVHQDEYEHSLSYPPG